MRKEYNFKKGTRGKFFQKRKIQKTLRLDEDVLKFYVNMAESVGIPYQTLINLTLRKFAVEDGILLIKAPTKKAS